MRDCKHCKGVALPEYSGDPQYRIHRNALRRVAQGQADAVQQKLALQWIKEIACVFDSDISEAATDRDLFVNLGRQAAFHRVMAVINTHIEPEKPN